MYQQRPAPSETASKVTARPWLPDQLRAAGAADRVGSGLPTWYLVVDDLDGDRCRVTVDPWPEVDTDGRLAFPADAPTHLVALERRAMQATVDAARLARDPGDEAATRPLRIGDVFAVFGGLTVGDVVVAPDQPAADRGEGAGPGLVDVTASARTLTHAAAEAAATGTLEGPEAQRLGMVDRP